MPSAATMALVWESYRLHYAKLSRKAHDSGHEGTSAVLGAEARRAHRNAAACEVLVAEDEQRSV